MKTQSIETPAATATTSRIEPYLMFAGRCEEALDYYQRTVGAEIVVKMRFADCPEPIDPSMAPMDPQKIMHAQVRIGSATFMASDGCGAMELSFSGISLSLALGEVEEAKRIFDAFAKEGKVEMPMEETFFARTFGVVVDRFGVCWMILVEKPFPAAG